MKKIIIGFLGTIFFMQVFAESPQIVTLENNNDKISFYFYMINNKCSVVPYEYNFYLKPHESKQMTIYYSSNSSCRVDFHGYPEKPYQSGFAVYKLFSLTDVKNWICEKSRNGYYCYYVPNYSHVDYTITIDPQHIIIN